MADGDGRPTTTLLRAAGYAKDNRLLPSGFDLGKRFPDGIDPRTIAPAGTAGDPGFEPGAHQVVYDAGLDGSKGPYRASVEALYQSIKPSHARALRGNSSDDVAAFLGLYSRYNEPVVIGQVEAGIGE